jgi:putative membrane protein insertion efficiency factor
LRYVSLSRLQTVSLPELFTGKIAQTILHLYRIFLSPLLVALGGPACRFDPTCSAYAAEALTEHGLMTGGWMVLKRLCRCRPGGGYGYDPVKPAAPHLATK